MAINIPAIIIDRAIAPRRSSRLAHHFDEGACVGGPWDAEQDFSTIAPYTIEEAYEVADAIQRRNMGDLRDELMTGRG